MSTTRIEPERIHRLNEHPTRSDGRYALYWMQAAQRAEHNPALELAVRRANSEQVPLVVVAVVIPGYPESSARHHAFMLGGLTRALDAVERRGARPCLRVGDPVEIVTELATDATEVVLDRGYLAHQVAWYDSIVEHIDVAVTQVEGEVVVPVDAVSQQAEHAARTIRPKLLAERDRFVVDLAPTSIDVTTRPQGTASDVDRSVLGDDDGIARMLDELGLSDGPQPVTDPTPGTPAARAALDRLLDRIDTYDDDRNRYDDPDSSSGLSPYLHYGQISPVAVAHAALDRARDAAEPFLEELVVRRELAVNFVARTADYDSYGALPEWARRTLDEHRDDERDQVYTARQLERGETDDEVFNTIMHVIRRDGWVHNQLRMYWGKQFVRWANTPEHAFRTLLEINNRWFLDGRDANSFANVGWCFGLHDQGFQERAVSGKVRPFTTAALRRKGDLDGWVEAHRTTG